MTEAEARARLQRMVAHDQVPELTAGEIDDLLAQCRRTDRAGYAFSHPLWTPTWDLDAAASEGWSWKAAKVAGAYNFAEDGQRFDRSQMHAQCLAMARQYARGSGSARVRSTAFSHQEV